MGWCHEFGPDITENCGHPMTAGSSHCYCEECGVICEGRFAGCAEVWARGPKDVSLIRPRVHEVSHVETAAFEAVDAEFAPSSRLDELLTPAFEEPEDAPAHRRPR